MRKWKPYCNPRDQSAWYAVSNVYPTSQGTYRAMPGFKAVATKAHTTPGTELRAVAFGNLGDVIVGTNTKLWISDQTIVASSFVDRSKGAYVSTSDWSFAKFGKYHLAANGAAGDKIQARDSTGSGNFADIAAAPKATIIVVQSNAVLAFNTDAGGFHFAVSDVGDHTNWTTGEAVAATPITHRHGDITDAIAFRDYVLVFKASSIYRVRYVGGEVKWAVELLADGIGALRKGSAVSTGETCYFWAATGPMAFDGVQFRHLTPDSGVDPETGGPGLQPGSAYVVAGTYLPLERSVIWRTLNGTYYLVYNEISDAWGKFSAYKSDGTQMSADYVLLEDRGAHFVVPVSGGGVKIINLDDGVYSSSLTVAPTGITGSLTTTAIGDEVRYSEFTRLIPVISNPTGIPKTDTTSTLASTDLRLNIHTAENPFYFGENDTYSDQGAGVTAFSANPLSSSNGQVRFDFTLSARWARFQVYASTFFEIEDVIAVRTLGGTD